MKINYKRNVSKNTKISDLSDGTIIEYKISSDDEIYIGMVVSTFEGDTCICDLTDAIIYDDIERYEIIRMYDADDVTLTLG